MSNRVRYVGLAEETEFNEQPSPEASIHLPFSTADINPQGADDEFEQGYDRAASVKRASTYNVSGSIGYATDVNTVGYFLKWGLGGYVYDDTEGVHNFYGTNDYVLPSFVARVGFDFQEFLYKGLVIDQIDLSVDSGGRASLTANVNGAQDEKATLKSKDSLNTFTEKPLKFHEVTVEVDGVDVSAEIKNFTLSISNNTSTDGYGMGSRLLQYIEAGQRSTTLSHSLRFKDTSELEKFWGNASKGGDVDSESTEFSVKYTFDRGAEGVLVIELPRVYIDQHTRTGSNRESGTQDISMRALTGTVTLSDSTSIETDVYCTLENEVTSY